jgi:hypothetical protein
MTEEAGGVGWDAILFDFEGTLADLSMGGGRGARPYHDGRQGVPAVRDRNGGSSLDAWRAALAADVPVAVVSSSPIQPVARWFEEQDLAPPEVAVAYHDTVLHRPSPAPLEEALSRLGVTRGRRVLSLGDGADDVVAAVAAGLTPATLREHAPVHAPPALYVAEAGTLLEDDMPYALAGGMLSGQAEVSLRVELEDHELCIGGRLGDEVLSALLVDGAGGSWDPRVAELAHTLVIHALGAKPAGALLTWLPGYEPDRDPLVPLVKRLGSLTSLEAKPLLCLDSAERSVALTDTNPSVSGRTVLVLCALRTTGAGLSRAAGLLRAAGASRVVGLVLAQEETPGAGPLATWGPVRLANDDLRRLRSRPRPEPGARGADDR